MRRYQKYTKELLANLAAKTTSVVGIMRSMGGPIASGGTHNHIAKLLKKYEIDTSHFVKCPGTRTGSGKKRSFESILVLRTSGTRTPAVQLRRALIESGRKYKCEKCGNGGTWQEQDLRLQVDHKDSNYLDDRAENLRFLCPNCHSQTPNYCQNKGYTSLLARHSPRKYRPRKPRKG